MRSAPKHLATPERRWFSELAREYGITDSGGIALLTAAAEAKQRHREAWEQIGREGQVVVDRFGKPVPHPASRIEFAARQQVLAALRELHLDLEPLKAMGRPPSAAAGVTEL